MKTNQFAARFCRRAIFVTFLPAVLAGCLAQGAIWSTNTSLMDPRYWHSAVLLPSGQVLEVGGFDLSGTAEEGELYDPATKSWTKTQAMNDSRAVFTATLLTNGEVLVAGGLFYQAPYAPGSLDSAELFNPTNGSWTTTGSLAEPLWAQTATVLPNGQVLVAGGNGEYGAETNCELYDPSTGGWTLTGGMNVPRSYHTATLLPSGQVLVAGGDQSNPSTSELYNPATGTWTMTVNSMVTGCFLHTATLLPNGQVLVAGGYGPGGSPISSSELFSPAAQTWTPTAAPLNVARAEHTASLLPDGTVLVAGGYTEQEYAGAISSAEIYNPATEIWTLTNGMNSARGDFTATTLTNGDVLVAGGYTDPGAVLAATELYGTNSTTLNLYGTMLAPSGGFQISFAAFPHSTNTISSATNLAGPLPDWTALGVASEFSPGLFIFTDTNTANYPGRFYRASGP